MSRVLEKICAEKRHAVAQRERKTPLENLKSKCEQKFSTHSFTNRIREKAKEGPAIIAEVKKASPSKGVIRPDYKPAAIAGAYRQAGAACLSVLTEEAHFQGSDSDLLIARGASGLPVLRKDFILTPYQVYETAALGADCLLLIMAALDDETYHELYALAESLGLDILVEVHDEAELTRAKTAHPAMIGVNNRNLKRLEVDTETARRLAEKMPPNALRIAESGLKSRAEIDSLRACGYHGFLIGESLLVEDDPGAALRTLLAA